jgi:uncharacterized cupin superfamily protein
MAIVLRDAATASLGEQRPKATSLGNDQFEASRVVWSHEERGRSIRTGIWEATPGTFTARRDGYHEINQILSGRATVVPEGAPAIELAAGDVLVTPAGWVGVWHVHETIRKMYVITDA